MAPAQHPITSLAAYGAYEAPMLHEDFLPGERIGRPLASRGRSLLRRAGLLVILSGAGWVLFNTQPYWAAWSSAAMTAVSPLIAALTSPDESAASSPRRERNAARFAEPAASAMTLTALPERQVREQPKMAAIEVPPPKPLPAASTPAPPDAAKSAAPPLTTASLPATSGSEAAGPLPPVHADPADPYQVRAEAAGLHPGLSRVLLTRLSPTDYRNAEYAVRTALAQTRDGAVFVWPRQRTPELALFKVTFVPGAAPDCRRYVVTVVKDRWATTALPMERCGAQAGLLRRTSHQQRF